MLHSPLLQNHLPNPPRIRLTDLAGRDVRRWHPRLSEAGIAAYQRAQRGREGTGTAWDEARRQAAMAPCPDLAESDRKDVCGYGYAILEVGLEARSNRSPVTLSRNPFPNPAIAFWTAWGTIKNLGETFRPADPWILRMNRTLGRFD